jgi:outer membrane receptor protein involved in Fe transport
LATTLDVTNLYRAQNLDTQSRITGRGPVFATILGFRYVTLPSSGFDGAGVTITSNSAFEPAASYEPYYAQSQAYTTVDAYAGFRVARTLVLTLRGFNLLDARYAVYNGFPMPGPGFAVELRSR